MKSSAITIGEAARRLGVRASAIRYYEAQGLIPNLPRSHGRRILDPDTFFRLEILLEARRLGFGIRELRAVRSGGRAAWRELAMRRVATLEAEAVERAARVKRLRDLGACGCVSMNGCALIGA